jgi:hypothetical protein
MAYFAHSQFDGDPLELALVKSFVLLEHLKHTYAVDRGYPYIRGFFRLVGATDARPGPRWPFKALLTEMFQDVGMSPELDSIVDLRNEILHSGLSFLPHERQWKIYETAQDTLREYLLRLVRYSGTYFPFSSPNHGVQI